MPASSFTRERYLTQVRRWTFDWVDWLAGDTVATSSWAASGDLTTASGALTTTTTSIRVSGGSGSTGWVANTITTAGGNTEKRVLYFSYLG